MTTPLPSRREQSKAANVLAKNVQENMATWTADQFHLFEETMELVREGAPVQWLKLYMEAVKLGIVKESNININFHRQQDREDLQALVRSRIQLPANTHFTPYEEIKPLQTITTQREEEH